MEMNAKKNAIHLGVRIGIMFLVAAIAFILTAYYIVSDNVETLLTEYSFKLFDSMTQQGVSAIDAELNARQLEIQLLADNYSLNLQLEKNAPPPQMQNAIQTRYIPRESTESTKDLLTRQDIQQALSGEVSVHGPSFNEENNYLISYSAPVRNGDEIIGVLTADIDGYIFCDIIAGFLFMNTGESYIINAEGTDIAVSDPDHIEWVNDQYNSKKLLAQQEDPTVRSIMELEQKGLDGETGIDTYYWEDGLVYVSYAPVNAQPWVFLLGAREEELKAMTQTAFYTSLVKGHILQICFVIFLVLSGLIVYWIISSAKKSEEINQKLEQIANIDALTGLYNRRYLENSIEHQWKYPVRVSGHAAVFMADIDDFKKYNDCFGHPKGDECLRTVARTIRDSLHGYDSYTMRYGGEEFIVVAFQMDKDAALKAGSDMCTHVEDEKIEAPNGGSVTLSVGLCYVENTSDISLAECIKFADSALYQAKQEGKNRCILFNDANNSTNKNDSQINTVTS